MAEFCDECRAEMGAPPGPKSDEAIAKELAKEHGKWSLLCEGCCSGITYNSEGERSVVPLLRESGDRRQLLRESGDRRRLRRRLPGYSPYGPGEGPAAAAEYECLKCGYRTSDPSRMYGPCPSCGGTLVAVSEGSLRRKGTELIGLTDEQKHQAADVLETDIRASLGVSFKQILGPGQGVNVGTLFEIIGMALTRFARAVDATGRKEETKDG